MTLKCDTCQKQYQGADNVLRCRVESSGLKCTERLAAMCAKFERKPTPGSEEAELLFGLCPHQGRGD